MIALCERSLEGLLLHTASVDHSRFDREIRFGLTRGVALECMSDCVLIFSESDQQLHRLNVTSSVLACRLESGATFDELAAELTAQGVELVTAREWTHAFLTDLSALAVLQGCGGSNPSPIATKQYIRLASVNVSLAYETATLGRLIGPCFAHLEVPSFTGAMYRISEANQFAFIAKTGEPALAVSLSMAAVRLKGLLLEEVLSSGEALAALHAALLMRHGGGLLLLGPPASGKTTLAIALLQHGFRYGSDDVTLVSASGLLSGVPLAPSVKESGWARLRSKLANASTHLRPDGQSVRYLPLAPETLTSRPCPLKTLVRLRRSEHDQIPRTAKITTEEALADLLHESRSQNGRCSVEIIAALANAMRGTDCIDLHYAEATDAASFLSKLLGP